MKARRGFTLIELMVVILIVAILAAVAIPIMRGKIDAAKWSEGKAIMGSIASAMRAHAAESGLDVDYDALDANLEDGPELGFRTGDLDGTYFRAADFSISGTYTASTNVYLYTISANAGIGITAPAVVTLNQAGDWTP